LLWKEEKQAHAKTKAKLTEAQDQLELALGEVDILKKQIQREKAQFEQTLVVSPTSLFITVVTCFNAGSNGVDLIGLLGGHKGRLGVWETKSPRS